MKRVIIILVAVVVLSGILSSCNNHTCPAYAHNSETDQVENIN